MTRFSWTQPCCAACWRERNPGRKPVALKDAERETCVHCGLSAQSGIFVRIDPAEAVHPTRTKDGASC